MSRPVDVCVQGAGVVGRTMSLLLAGLRLRVGLVGANVAAPADRPDVRCYAMSRASKQVLESVRAWPAEHAVTAVKHMQVHGDAGGRVQFEAAAEGVEALAWIVDAVALESRLAEAVSYQPLIECIPQGESAALTVLCEGHASAGREALGVEVENLPYRQVALATRVRCGKPHEQTAWQWFHGGEVLAFLPIGGPAGNSVAVVWSVHADRLEEMQRLSDGALAQALAQASQHQLGAIEVMGPRGIWPLQQARVAHWCGTFPARPGASWVLAGDAAHQVHPLAGQGLNLGLGDASELASVLGGREYWRNVSDMKLLRQYERARKLAIGPIGLAMDGLQRLFQPQESRWSGVRNAGMNGFDRMARLKSWVVAHAMKSA